MAKSPSSPRVARPRLGLPVERTSDLWWKNAVIYCLDVETFLDSNRDGVGDFPGLVQRIDYIASLGVSGVWLMPFYASPGKDDGYDVSDYYAIDPRLGDFGDFLDFVRTAKDRGLRVLADLVINHTSIEHPWFQASRSDPESPFRDYYVWRDEPSADFDDPPFPGEQNSSWTYDEVAGQYYLHRFYDHQADLNPASPRVREELQEIAGFWLELGLSGYRVDAVPFFLELDGIEQDVDFEPHDLLRQLRAYVNRRKGDAILLGEVNLPLEEAARYFGQACDELHMIFNFTLNQKIHLALARKDAGPIRECLESMPELPECTQWANFLTNHDELTLDRLSANERDEVFEAFAPDEDMRIYGRGIRRRLPPMLGGDRARLELAYSLLFSMPGTPVLFYGEEIGMGENLELEGRWAVRSAMQWSDEENAGFSELPAEQLERRPPSGAYSPEHVNVASARRDPKSLLSWMTRLIRRRRDCPELGFGSYALIDAGASELLAHCVDWADSTLVFVHNLSGRQRRARLALDLPEDFQELVEIFAEGDAPPRSQTDLELSLPAYGYRWFRVRRHGKRLPL